MMLDGKDNSDAKENDPEKLAQLLEIELMQKRAAWQQAKARRGGLRAVSFLFLFVVIVAALVAFFVFLSPDRVHEMRSGSTEPATPTPSATPP